MLQDWELGLAVNHALSYIKPDEELRTAIVDGRMRTREDVEREVARMLADDSIRKPRILRFFRDYFDHDLGGYICKDNNAIAESGVAGGNGHYRAMFDATASTDRLIELILERGQGRPQRIADHPAGRRDQGRQQLLRQKTHPRREGRCRGREEKSRRGAGEEGCSRTGPIEAKLAEIETQLEELKGKPEGRQTLKSLTKQKRELVAAKKKLEGNRRDRNRGSLAVATANLTGPKIYARVSHRSFGNGSMQPERTLATAPEGERMGILTHPSWLVSHSDAMDNHAILRGRWIRERLLGGGIPDVPITVDAMLPDEPKTPLRERMRVTREKYCWTCHEKMDPLGLPFEMYNHAGLFRTTELDKPVDTTGEIVDSGDPALDGPVKDAIDMIQKLAESERVEQVFVRHAFRFWMGRNETLNDAPVLQAAHKAYRDSGGSMNALITSLLTSDAFLYRKTNRSGRTKRHSNELFQ